MAQNLDGGKWYGPNEPLPYPPAQFNQYEQDGHTEFYHNGKTGRAYTWHYNKVVGQHGWLVQSVRMADCCGS